MHPRHWTITFQRSTVDLTFNKIRVIHRFKNSSCIKTAIIFTQLSKLNSIIFRTTVQTSYIRNSQLCSCLLQRAFKWAAIVCRVSYQIKVQTTFKNKIAFSSRRVCLQDLSALSTFICSFKLVFLKAETPALVLTFTFGVTWSRR